MEDKEAIHSLGHCRAGGRRGRLRHVQLRGIIPAARKNPEINAGFSVVCDDTGWLFVSKRSVKKSLSTKDRVDVRRQPTVENPVSRVTAVCYVLDLSSPSLVQTFRSRSQDMLLASYPAVRGTLARVFSRLVTQPRGSISPQPNLTSYPLRTFLAISVRKSNETVPQ